MPNFRPFRFFRDVDEEGNENVFAALTNVGLYGPNEEHYGLNDGPNEVFQDPRRGYGTHGHYEGLGATFLRSNSGVSMTGADPECLGEEISEEEAQEIHPRLFERIDSITNKSPTQC